MEPFIGLVVFFVLLFSGVWGSMVLFTRLKSSSSRLDSRPDDPRIEEIREDTHQLEARLERVEEELSFLQELYKPESPVRLRSPDSHDS